MMYCSCSGFKFSLARLAVFLPMPSHAVPDEVALDRLVIRMLRLGCPKVFVWLVVLVWFTDNLPTQDRPFRLVEFFSGDQAISRTADRCMIATASLDIRLGEQSGVKHSRGRTRKENPMDMASDSGFAFLF